MPKGIRKSSNKGMIKERTTEAQQMEHKLQILELLDSCEAKTLSSAARKLGLSPTKMRDWAKYDEHFREQVKQAQKVLADKLIEEILDNTDAKMPQVVAKIFIIKGLRPEFRDSYKIVEFKDQRALEILEKLRLLGLQPKAPVPAPEPEPENPLTGTIERINMADNAN